MALLVVGLVVLLGVHLIGVAAPGLRAAAIERFGRLPYRGVHSLMSLAGLVLVILGFREAWAESSMVYLPSPAWRPVTRSLMLPALILAVASALPWGYISRAVRYPLLVATIIWSASHLFVNGDSAGVVLFGAILVWALVEILLQPRRTPILPVRPALASDLIAIVIGAGLYALLLWRLHFWLFGVDPLA